MIFSLFAKNLDQKLTNKIICYITHSNFLNYINMSYQSFEVTDAILEEIIDDAYPLFYSVPGISKRTRSLLAYYKSEEQDHRTILGHPHNRSNLAELVAFILSPHACICQRHSQVDREKKSLSAV